MNFKIVEATPKIWREMPQDRAMNMTEWLEESFGNYSIDDYYEAWQKSIAYGHDPDNVAFYKSYYMRMLMKVWTEP